MIDSMKQLENKHLLW